MIPAADAPPAVQVSAGVDLFNLWPTESRSGRPTLAVRFVDPGWSGMGWDQAVTVPIGDTLRVGLREQVVVEAQDWYDEGFSGSKWHFVTSLALGAERRLPLGLQAGGYLLPGVRVVAMKQVVDVPARGLDFTWSDTSALPCLSASGVVRWWPTAALGVHVDVRVPVADFTRAWSFPDRFLGAGVDVAIR